MKKSIALTPLFVMLLVLIHGCDSGGSSASSQAQPQTATGIFLDSPVSGLNFQSDSTSGVTDSNGAFQYRPGETVQFSLGAINLGSATGAAEVTPLDLVGARSLDDARQLGLESALINRLLLLQSLDADGNPDNGIDLTGITTSTGTTNIDFDLPTDVFANGAYKQLVNELGGRYVSAKQATNHFLGSVGQSVTVSLIQTQSTDSNADGVVEQNATFEHNELGQLVTITSGDLVSRLTYTGSGEIATIEDFVNGELNSAERNLYDANGRLVETTRERLGETVFTSESEYDSVGNLVKTTSVTLASTFFRPLTAYFSEVVLATSILSIPQVSLRPFNPATDIVRGAIDFVPTGAIAFPLGQAEALEATTRYTYEADGTLSRIDQNVNDASVVFRLSSDGCYETESSGSPIGFGLAPVFPGLPNCDPNLATERDSLGRTIELRRTNPTQIIRFEYEGQLLVSQSTESTLANGNPRIFEVRYEYNEFDDLITIEQLIDGELTGRRTRTFERRVLSRLP